MGRLVGVLSHLGGVLRRLGAVLGRLGVVLGRLGSVLRRLGASWAVPERSGGVSRGSRARNNEFSMVLGGFGGVSPWTGVCARYGRAFRSGPLNPKIKPHTPGTGTGLGCLLSGFSPVHGHALLAAWPHTSTRAWA